MRPKIMAISLFLACCFFVIVAIFQESEIKEAALNVSGIMCLVGSFICASLDFIATRKILKEND